MCLKSAFRNRAGSVDWANGVRLVPPASTGHLLASTVMSGVLAGDTEMTSATVGAGDKRLADKIAVDLGNFFIDQDWIMPDTVIRPHF
jgi:hypothetical protein